MSLKITSAGDVYVDGSFSYNLATRQKQEDFEFIATSGQTTFTVNYIPGQIDVYVNGVKLLKTDFVATSGTSVVLNTPLVLNDEVSIKVFSNFEVANAYTKSEVDTLFTNFPIASTSTVGKVSLATNTEVQTGTNTTKAVTPKALFDSSMTCKAWVNFNGVPLTGTYVQSGTTITVTMTAHGMSTGMIANLDFTSGTAVDQAGAVITYVDANTFTVVAGSSLSTSGNVTRNNYIRKAFNVSSIVDNGTGNYTVNFTTPMVDANYATLVTSSVAINSSDSAVKSDFTTSSSVRVYSMTATGENTDSPYLGVSIFR